MMERDESPRRRHILASINPEPPKEIRHHESPAISPSPDRTDGSRNDHISDADANKQPKPSSRHRGLRLKDPTRPRSSRHRRDRDRDRDRDRGRDRDRDRDRDSYRDRSRSKSRGGSGSRSRDRGKDGDRTRKGDEARDRSRDRDSDGRRRRRRRRRRSRSPTPPNPHEPQPLDPDAAFRESLFDAMADDEGAAYWEGVYGQPVHVYPNVKPGPEGELERMTDEEYVDHIRRKMWEKTHEGLLEQQKKRDEARAARERNEKERRRLEREIQKSILLGEERRTKRRSGERWKGYLERWVSWDGSVEGIPWPVESNSREDVGEDAVKSFFLAGLRQEGVDEKDYALKLKDERVRWHPDKIQQRLGGEVEEEVMKAVTMIFQTIDKLWNDTRQKAS
jgi:hypothetical protein